ncbi:hypothetical protein BGZ63DRAFT_372908 [Mariannaea sp. PMI_226]|nr:hypothetical protein BGZ63DRAFT_372908 [Mariannaea sp. PMI_226]
MCGPENTNRPRGGALVALNPPINTIQLPFSLCGDLSFHTPGCPGSTTATHARLTPSENCVVEHLSDLHVVIHSSGDLTRNAHDCGLFQQFSLPSSLKICNDNYVELSLDKPLSLEVGDGGIIGRRVSLYSRPVSGREAVVAEGIIGFNFMNPAQVSPS